MNSSNFNSINFFLAFQKGKKLKKSKRTQQAFLASMMPSDNPVSILGTMALPEKEVEKAERIKAENENIILKKANKVLFDAVLFTLNDPSLNGGNSALKETFSKALAEKSKEQNLDLSEYLEKVFQGSSTSGSASVRGKENRIFTSKK